MARDSAHGSLLDSIVGVLFGLLAGSNLVQGAWITDLPWLNLTTLSFALAAPMALFALTHRIPLPAVAALLALIGSLSCGFVSEAASASAEAKRIGVVLAVGFVTIAAALTLNNRRRLLAFFTSLVLLALVVLAGQVLLPDPDFLATGRRTPVGLNSIGAGRLVGAGLVVLIAAWGFRSNRRYRPGLALLAVPLGVGLILAGSRGPVLGVVAALAFLLWRNPGIRARSKVVLTGLALVVGYGTYLVLRAAGSRAVSEVGSGRSQLYADAIAVALQHPLGIGWGNFYRYVQSSVSVSIQGENLYAHNIFLEFWIEAGIAGALLFSIFIAIVATRAWRQSSSPLSLVLAALAINVLVGALFSSDIIGNRMMWVAFGAILAGVSQAAPRRMNSARG